MQSQFLLTPFCNYWHVFVEPALLLVTQLVLPIPLIAILISSLVRTGSTIIILTMVHVILLSIWIFNLCYLFLCVIKKNEYIPLVHTQIPCPLSYLEQFIIGLCVSKQKDWPYETSYFAEWNDSFPLLIKRHTIIQWLSILFIKHGN